VSQNFIRYFHSVIVSVCMVDIRILCQLKRTM
jgi:hypothetical protein